MLSRALAAAAADRQASLAKSARSAHARHRLLLLPLPLLSACKQIGAQLLCCRPHSRSLHSTPVGIRSAAALAAGAGGGTECLGARCQSLSEPTPRVLRFRPYDQVRATADDAYDRSSDDRGADP